MGETIRGGRDAEGGHTLKRGRTRFCAVPLPERCIGLSFAEFMASERPFIGRGVALMAERRW